uniref:Uncharacterized protein n=1 Tax=Ditylenchus dipsaci TaxID=166011 RepID=A0A915ENM8_9BILA
MNCKSDTVVVVDKVIVSKVQDAVVPLQRAKVESPQPYFVHSPSDSVANVANVELIGDASFGNPSWVSALTYPNLGSPRIGTLSNWRFCTLKTPTRDFEEMGYPLHVFLSQLSKMGNGGSSGGFVCDGSTPGGGACDGGVMGGEASWCGGCSQNGGSYGDSGSGSGSGSGQ